MTWTTARRTLPGVLFPLLFAGCGRDLTEVVVVVQSDLTVPVEVDGADVAAVQGPFAPLVNQFFQGSGVALPPFPLSFGFLSGGGTDNFSIVVRLFRGTNLGVNPTLVVSRTVTDIRFVDEKTMMLVLPMRRACACQGTTCPSPGNPECDNIDRPELQPFDPAVAPPSTMMGTGGVVVGGGMPTPQPK
jgi:hypothetical protein